MVSLSSNFANFDTEYGLELGDQFFKCCGWIGAEGGVEEERFDHTNHIGIFHFEELCEMIPSHTTS